MQSVLDFLKRGDTFSEENISFKVSTKGKSVKSVFASLMQVVVLIISIAYGTSKWIQLIKFQNTILQSYVSDNNIPSNFTTTFKVGEVTNNYIFNVAFGMLNSDYQQPADLSKIGYYAVYLEQWVIDGDGEDVSAAFVAGAEKALQLAQQAYCLAAERILQLQLIEQIPAVTYIEDLDGPGLAARGVQFADRYSLTVKVENGYFAVEAPTRDAALALAQRAVPRADDPPPPSTSTTVPPTTPPTTTLTTEAGAPVATRSNDLMPLIILVSCGLLLTL